MNIGPFYINALAVPGALIGGFIAGCIEVTLGQMNFITFLLCVGVGAYVGHKWPQDKL
jgi:hypothetical protein